MTDQPIFKTIREQIVARLRDDVIGQVFKPGENLREYALSKRYGVSRSPIRDALLQLTQEGLLVATPNCGVRVGSRLDDEVQPLVIDVRLRVERFALDRVMKNTLDETVPLLESRLEANKRACEEGVLAAIVKSDMEFHQCLIDGANCEKLGGIWKQIVASMMLHYERLGDWMASYKEHKAIYAAIKKGDRKAARDALKANIR